MKAQEVAAICAAMAARAKEGDVEAARVVVELRRLQVGGVPEVAGAKEGAGAGSR